MFPKLAMHFVAALFTPLLKAPIIILFKASVLASVNSFNVTSARVSVKQFVMRGTLAEVNTQHKQF